MPAYKVGKSSSTRDRKALVSCVKALGVAADMPCSHCESSGALCIFSSRSPKCSECIRLGCRCDGNFSKSDFDRLDAEKKKLKAALSAANTQIQQKAAEAVSLGKRIESLEEAQGKMIERGVRSLAELEHEEGLQAQQSNVAPESVFDEQQLAALLAFSPGPGSGGDNSQVSQG